MKIQHLSIIIVILLFLGIAFPKPTQAQDAHFIVNSTTQCFAQNIDYYKQVYNSTMNHINKLVADSLHVQNQSINEVNNQLFSAVTNHTYDKVNEATYCLGIENVNRTRLALPLPDTVKALTYNTTEMRQYLPVLVDSSYYLQAYDDVMNQLNLLRNQISNLEKQISELNTTSPNGSEIQRLQEQINENKEKGKSLVAELDLVQNESRALFALDNVTKERLDSAQKVLSEKYLVPSSQYYIGPNPVEGVWANYYYKNIEIVFDPDKTINNPGDNTSPEIISDIKKITGDIPLKISYDKIVPIGNNKNGSNGNKLILEPPLKQFQTGVHAQNVKCEKGYELILKSQDGSPRCVSPDTAQKLIERGWAREINTSVSEQRSEKLQVLTQPSNETLPSCASKIKHQTVFAGYAGELSCPALPFTMSSKMLNYTGFYGVYREINSSALVTANTYFSNALQEQLDKSGNDRSEGNFVLQPGHNGTITYEITGHAGRCIGNCPPNLTYPTQDNLTNTATFYNHVNAEMIYPHPGLFVFYYPTDVIVKDNSTEIVKATITASNDAPRGTYWVILEPGNCDGGPLVLLTVSDCEK